MMNRRDKSLQPWVARPIQTIWYRWYNQTADTLGKEGVRYLKLGSQPPCRLLARLTRGTTAQTSVLDVVPVLRAPIPLRPILSR